MDPSRSHRPRPCASLRSVELAGRAVALSVDIPVHFDEPLAPHHKLIGRWVASRKKLRRACTRVEARRHIENVFDTAVLDVLGTIAFVDLRVVVLRGEGDGPPAIAVICDTIGQLDLGWIEESEAPASWRAAAYRMLEQTLGYALPVAGYKDLFDEIAIYYWDGETTDEAARRSLVHMHGADPDDLDEMALPSTMDARRPEWMIEAHAAPTRQLPATLRKAMRKVDRAYKALRGFPPDRNAWRFEMDALYEYVPGIEECASFPPLTLVPLEQFARELDDVTQSGMELGFMDIAGLCPLKDTERIADWFTSLRLGARFLAAAHELIQLDPANL
ncbi:hypothetical protein [Sphingomonas oryzagri]